MLVGVGLLIACGSSCDTFWPRMPDGTGEVCDVGADCDAGLVCVSEADVFASSGFIAEEIVGTCQVPCDEYDDCRFNGAYSCHDCYHGPSEVSFCTFDYCI